jgi:hypothetical protein
MRLSNISDFTLFGVFQLLLAVVALAASDTRIVTNVTCGELHLISTSNVEFHFADQECGDTASTVFVLEFLTNTSTPNFGLENILIVIRSVIIRGSLSVVVAKTPNSTAVDTERPSLRNFVLCLQNVSILVGTVNQSAHPNMPKLLADRKDTTSWTLLWIPLLSDPTTSRPATGLIDNLQVIMTDVVIATNTGVTSSFLDSLIVVQSTLLYNVMISIVNSSLHVNTSSTLIALYGSVHVVGLKFLSQNVTLIATCASRGCIPVFVACGRYRWNQSVSTTFVGVGDANVTLVASNVTWSVIPRPLGPPVGVAFPVLGNVFGIGDGFCGVVAVSLFQKPSSDDNVTIERVLLRMFNCTVRFWIAGESAEDEVISNLDGFEVGVFVITGHTDRGDMLNGSIVQVIASSIAIRAATVTIVRTDYLRGSVFNTSITVQDIGPICQLFCQVRRSSTASSAFSSIVYTVFAPFSGLAPSLIVIQRISKALMYVQSGEVLPKLYPNSSLQLVAATALFIGRSEHVEVIIDTVRISTQFQNGTWMPTVAAPFLLPILANVASALFASPERVGLNSSVEIRNSELHFLGIETNVSQFSSPGALNVEVAALFLPSCHGAVVEIVNTSVMANADTICVRSASSISLTLFLNIISLQSFLKLFSIVLSRPPYAFLSGASSQTSFSGISASTLRIRGASVVEQRWRPQSQTPADPANMCTFERVCMFNTSAVVLGSQVSVSTEIVVENVTFLATLCPFSANELIVSVFSVAIESSVVSGWSRLVMALTNTTLNILLLVPLGMLGVNGLVSSNLTFQNAEFIMRDCVIHRAAVVIVDASPDSYVGIIASSIFPNSRESLAILFEQNAKVVIQRSRLFSFAPRLHLFGSIKARSPAVNIWNESHIVLGCNQWNGLPFPGPETSWSSFAGVPRSARMFNESIEASSTAPRFNGCSMPLYSPTISAEMTASLPLLPPEIKLPTIAPNTAIIALAALDGGPLIALGQSACGSAELKKATSDTRFLLSPFYDFGGEISALGNIGVFVTLVLLHWFVSAVILKQIDEKQESVKRSPPLAAKEFTVFQMDSTKKRKKERQRILGAPWWPTPGAVKAHFPNVSIQALIFLMPGTVFCAMNVVTQGSTVSWSDSPAVSISVGALSVLCAVAPCAVLVYIEKANCNTRIRNSPPPKKSDRRFLGNMKFGKYSHKIRYSSQWLPAFAVPHGRWEPVEVRSTLGALRGLVRGDEAKQCYTRYAMLPPAMTVLVHGLLGVQGPPAWWCPLQWAILVAASLACAAVFLFVKPTRIPLTNIFLAAQHFTQALIFVLSAIVQNFRSTSAVTALLAFSTLSTIIAILKLVHTLVVMLWERDRAAAPATSATSATTSTGSLMLTLQISRRDNAAGEVNAFDKGLHARTSRLELQSALYLVGGNRRGMEESRFQNEYRGGADDDDDQQENILGGSSGGNNEIDVSSSSRQRHRSDSLSVCRGGRVAALWSSSGDYRAFRNRTRVPETLAEQLTALNELIYLVASQHEERVQRL